MNFLQRVSTGKNFKKIVITTFFGLSALVWLMMHIYGYYYVSTDDAYVNANVVQIAPRITGKVVNLYVKNNDYVQKGQALFDVDPRPYEIAVNSAQAELDISNAELDKTNITAKRTLALVKRHFSSPQDGDNAVANLKTANGGVELAKAKLDQAMLNLQFTKVTAPVSGWVTNLTLRAGNIIPANQPLFALISDAEFWTDANFKENEMQAIKAGQTAMIETDMYPGKHFKGVVESISGGAGAAFSLLPPQNATGNWVKVTQRIPIRIHILNPEKKFPLRIGSSATVTVNLKKYS